MEKKRLVTVKCRISDVVSGRYVQQEGMSPSFVISPAGQILGRVRVLAAITNKFVSEDGNYSFIVLDDGTESLRSKAFNASEIFSKTEAGQTADLIGRVREYNGERYLVPEVLRLVSDPNLETLRRLEIVRGMKDFAERKKMILDAQKKFSSVEEVKKALSGKVSPDEVDGVMSSEVSAEEERNEEDEEQDKKNAKDLVMKVISELDTGEGVEYSKVVESAGLPESVVENAINDLLSEGSCYEPRAGKIKVL